MQASEVKERGRPSGTDVGSRLSVRICAGLVSPALLLLVWQLAHSLNLVSPTLLPSPLRTLSALMMLFLRFELHHHFVMTLYRMMAGFSLAAAVGIVLGLAMGMCRPLYYAAIPTVDFVRSIPVTSLYPAFVLVLGIDDASKIGMVFVGSVFVVALNTAYGVFHSSKTRQQMAIVYGSSWLQLIRYVVFPDALPQTMIGVRVALSYSLIVALLCEMFMGARYGLGQKLMDAYTTFAIDEMYAVILLAGLFGFLLNRLCVQVEQLLIPWIEK